MKRLGLSVLLLSLALNAPASGQSMFYKYFYEGCNQWSCHWASITEVQYGDVPSPWGFGPVYWALGTFSFGVFGQYAGILPGDLLGGTHYASMFDGNGYIWSPLGWDDYNFYRSHSEIEPIIGDHAFELPSHFGIYMVYGPAGYTDHDEYGDGVAEQFGAGVTLNLVHVAVPEPATVLLLATSLIGLAAVAARRRRGTLT